MLALAADGQIKPHGCHKSLKKVAKVPFYFSSGRLNHKQANFTMESDYSFSSSEFPMQFREEKVRKREKVTTANTFPPFSLFYVAAH